jgi:protein LTV1
MQHLKPVGQGGFDSFLIPAPRGSGVAPGMKGGAVKGKGKAKAEDLFLPDGVLASEKELSLQEAYAREENIPAELQGLQPDMNPHLRQVLEALDDEAFEVDEDAGDDGNWFDSLVGGGEVHEGEEAPDFEFEEWGVDEQAPARPTEAELPEDASWEERFKAFKRDQQARGDDQVSAWGEEDAYGDERSEGADTLGSLPANFSDMIVAGGKKRRGKRGPSDASGMSMSSSAVFRNQGLRDLDDRFDKVRLIQLFALTYCLGLNLCERTPLSRGTDLVQIEEDYEFDDEEEDFDDNMSLASGMSGMSAMSSMSRASLFSTAPPLVSREDFDSIMDDFLDNYEVVGNKYRQALGGTQLSGPEKLQVLRAAVESEEEGIGKEENRKRILEIERLGRGVRAPIEKMSRVKREEDEGEKWDVETILSESSLPSAVLLFRRCSPDGRSAPFRYTRPLGLRRPGPPITANKQPHIQIQRITPA